MSCFIVKNETISQIVNQLEFEIRDNLYLKNKLEELGVNTNNKYWQEELAQAMFDLNVKAFNNRYDEKPVIKKSSFEYSFGKFVGRTRAVKALQCWLYQCLEGNIPEESELYQFFRNYFEKHLLFEIVSDLPDYKEADWS